MHARPKFLVLLAGALSGLLLLALSAPLDAGEGPDAGRPASGPGDVWPARAAREAADRVRTKVVVLKTARGSSRSSATGFLAGPRLVVTAGHAVTADMQVTAWVNGVRYAAEVTAFHSEQDLAALRLRAPDLLLKPAELAESSLGLADLEPLIILAGPSQQAGAHGDPADRVSIPALFQGRVRLRLPSGKMGTMLQVEGSVERGDSGSPVVRIKDGRVVGVLSSRELPDANGVSHSAYAVPVEALRPWLAGAAAGAAATRRTEEEFYLLDLGRPRP